MGYPIVGLGEFTKVHQAGGKRPNSVPFPPQWLSGLISVFDKPTLQYITVCRNHMN
jgi:hypothetical protein